MIGIEDNLEECASRLGLKLAHDGWYCGRVKGFPVGLKLIEPSGAASLLFQIRYPFDPAQKQVTALRCGEELEELTAAEKLELSLENRVAWLTFVEGKKHLADRSAERVLESVLVALEKAELKGRADRCHYCEKETVREVSCIDGKAVQICPACLSQHTQTSKAQRVESVTSAIPLALACPLAAAVGGIAWVAGWIGYDLVFEWLHTDRIQVPNLLMVAPLLLLAFGVGGPVGWILMHVGQKHYRFLRAALVIVFTSLGITFGEALYLTWLIYRDVKVVAFGEAIRLIPKFWLSLSSSYTNFKILAAVGAVFMALTIDRYSTKPKIIL